jgi:hypothetical protein
MMILLNILIVILLLVLGVQDYKDREVSLWLFCTLGALSILKLYFNAISDIYIDVIFNLGLLTVQMLLLYLYFNILRKKDVRGMIGLGDILFFIIIAFSFSLVYFLLFQIFSFLIALIFSAISRIRSQKLIPLAGIQAFCLSVIVLIEMSLGINFYDNMSIYLSLLNIISC